MLHSRGFLAEVFGILARHNISVDLITTSEVSVALTMDTTGSTSAGDTPADPGAADRALFAVPRGSGRKSGAGRPDWQ